MALRGYSQEIEKISAWSFPLAGMADIAVEIALRTFSGSLSARSRFRANASKGNYSRALPLLISEEIDNRG